MEHNNTFQKLPNQYPQSIGSQFKRSGDGFYIEHNNSTTQVDSIDVEFTIDDVEVVDGVSIKFVVNINGNYYTSNTLKEQLKAARNENNPYVSLNYISVVNIDGDRFRSLISNELSKKETKANVFVTNTLYSDEDIVKHIDWSVKPVQNIDEPSYATTRGEWNVDSYDDVVFNYENSVELEEQDEPTQTTTGPQIEDTADDVDESDDDVEDDTPTQGERTGPDVRRDQPRSGAQRELRFT